MKKLLLLTLAILTLVSCKESDSKKVDKDNTEKVSTEKIIKKKAKTPAERKKEGKTVRTELNTFLTEIPEELVFLNNTFSVQGIKKSSFVAEDVDEATKNELDNWFNKQSDDLVAAKWEKIVLQENEMIFEMLTNSHSYRKAQGGESALTDILSLSTVYNPKTKTYTLYVKPYSI